MTRDQWLNYIQKKRAEQLGLLKGLSPDKMTFEEYDERRAEFREKINLLNETERGLTSVTPGRDYSADRELLDRTLAV